MGIILLMKFFMLLVAVMALSSGQQADAFALDSYDVQVPSADPYKMGEEPSLAQTGSKNGNKWLYFRYHRYRRYYRYHRYFRYSYHRYFRYHRYGYVRYYRYRR